MEGIIDVYQTKAGIYVVESANPSGPKVLNEHPPGDLSHLNGEYNPFSDKDHFLARAGSNIPSRGDRFAVGTSLVQLMDFGYEVQGGRFQVEELGQVLRWGGCNVAEFQRRLGLYNRAVASFMEKCNAVERPYLDAQKVERDLRGRLNRVVANRSFDALLEFAVKDYDDPLDKSVILCGTVKGLWAINKSRWLMHPKSTFESSVRGTRHKYHVEVLPRSVGDIIQFSYDLEGLNSADGGLRVLEDFPVALPMRVNSIRMVSVAAVNWALAEHKQEDELVKEAKRRLGRYSKGKTEALDRKRLQALEGIRKPLFENHFEDLLQ